MWSDDWTVLLDCSVEPFSRTIQLRWLRKLLVILNPIGRFTGRSAGRTGKRCRKLLMKSRPARVVPGYVDLGSSNEAAVLACQESRRWDRMVGLIWIFFNIYLQLLTACLHFSSVWNRKLSTVRVAEPTAVFEWFRSKRYRGKRIRNGIDEAYRY